MTKLQSRWWLIIPALISLYLVTRLVNLTLLPIFTDEAIYIRWGQIGLRDASHRFLSLEDGKQPLFVWLMYPLLKVFPDPLVAGRMVSVIAGLFSLIGIATLARILFGKKAIVPAALIYITSPFFLFYDRLALYDSLATAFAIWALLLQILMVITLRLDTALLLGMAIGGGLLTKSSVQFSLYLLPVSLVLFDWNKKHRWGRLAKWASLALVATVSAIFFSWIIKLSPLQHMVGQKNLTFIYSFAEFFRNPLQHFLGNLKGLNSWLTGYLTWPWVFAIIATLPLILKSHFRQTILLLAWWLFPFISLAAFGKVLYPRFILFMSFPLLSILAYGLQTLAGKIKNYFLLFTFYFLLFSYPIYFSSQILFSPVNAPLPQVDRYQFLDDWPSGYGITEVNAFLKQEALKQPTFVATEGTFGLTPYALTIYLQGTPNLDIKGYWPISDGMPEILDVATTKTTFVLFKDTQEPSPEWPLELVSQYRKGRGNVFMKLYRVVNQ